MNFRGFARQVTLLLILTCLPIISPTSTYANTVPTIVIADTAIDSDNPEFSKNIILELCILEWAVCPNGQKFMQGKGAAKLPLDYLVNNGFNHGTQMVSAAVRTNPDLNIIFIRMFGNSSSGARLSAGSTTVALVLQWISQNQVLFNIQAAAISQGHHNLSSLTKGSDIKTFLHLKSRIFLSLNARELRVSSTSALNAMPRIPTVIFDKSNFLSSRLTKYPGVPSLIITAA